MYRYCILIALLAFACKNAEKDKNTLDRHARIIADRYIVEAVAKEYTHDSRDTIYRTLLDSFYSIHKLDSISFSDMIAKIKKDKKYNEKVEAEVNEILKIK